MSDHSSVMGLRLLRREVVCSLPGPNKGMLLFNESSFLPLLCLLRVFGDGLAAELLCCKFTALADSKSKGLPV